MFCTSALVKRYPGDYFVFNSLTWWAVVTTWTQNIWAYVDHSITIVTVITSWTLVTCCLTSQLLVFPVRTEDRGLATLGTLVTYWTGKSVWSDLPYWAIVTWITITWRNKDILLTKLLLFRPLHTKTSWLLRPTTLFSVHNSQFQWSLDPKK